MREKVLQLAVSTMVYKIKVTGTEYNQVWWGLAAEVSGVTSYWGFQIWTKKNNLFFFFLQFTCFCEMFLRKNWFPGFIMNLIVY